MGTSLHMSYNSWGTGKQEAKNLTVVLSAPCSTPGARLVCMDIEVHVEKCLAVCLLCALQAPDTYDLCFPVYGPVSTCRDFLEISNCAAASSLPLMLSQRAYRCLCPEGHATIHALGGSACSVPALPDKASYVTVMEVEVFDVRGSPCRPTACKWADRGRPGTCLAGSEPDAAAELREIPYHSAEECAACLVEFSSNAEAGQVVATPQSVLLE